MGRKETGGKTVRVMETRGKETGTKVTGAKETGGKETGAKKTGGDEMGRKATGTKAPRAKASGAQETGGKGDILMGEREMDNILPGDSTAGQNVNVGRANMFMRDGLHLSGNGAAVFTNELSAAVDSGMGSITNIFGSKHCLNLKSKGLLRGASNRTRSHQYTQTSNNMSGKHF